MTFEEFEKVFLFMFPLGEVNKVADEEDDFLTYTGRYKDIQACYYYYGGSESRSLEEEWKFLCGGIRATGNTLEEAIRDCMVKASAALDKAVVTQKEVLHAFSVITLYEVGKKSRE